jgi:hypothetical protein
MARGVVGWDAVAGRRMAAVTKRGHTTPGGGAGGLKELGDQAEKASMGEHGGGGLLVILGRESAGLRTGREVPLARTRPRRRRFQTIDRKPLGSEQRTRG